MGSAGVGRDGRNIHWFDDHRDDLSAVMYSGYISFLLSLSLSHIPYSTISYNLLTPNPPPPSSISSTTQPLEASTPSTRQSP